MRTNGGYVKMKIVYLIVALVSMLVVTAITDWEQDGNSVDLSYKQSSGKIYGVDGFTVLGDSSDFRQSSDYLVYDIDGDGKNEIIFVDTNILTIYDDELQVQAQKAAADEGMSTIISNPIVFDMNTTAAGKEVGIIMKDSSGNTYLYGYSVSGALMSRKLKSVNIRTGNFGNVYLLGDEYSSKYAIKDNGNFTILNSAGTVSCSYDLLVRDTANSTISMPMATDSYGTSWNGDFDGDGDKDYAFWHNCYIYVIDGSCNADLKYSAGSYCNQQDSGSYQPISFGNMNGGNLELATTTNGGGRASSLGIRSYIIVMNTYNQTVFTPVRHYCDPISGDPDAPYYNVHFGDFVTGTGIYTGDEILTAVGCDYRCERCSGQDSIRLEVYTESGLLANRSFYNYGTNGVGTANRGKITLADIDGTNYTHDFVTVSKLSTTGANLIQGSFRVSPSYVLQAQQFNTSTYTFVIGNVNLQGYSVSVADVDGNGGNDFVFQGLSTLVVGLESSILPQTENVTIVVRDLSDNSLISGAKIYVGANFDTTDTNGEASFYVNLTSTELNISVNNYNTYREPSITLTSGENTFYLSRLVQEPTILDSIYNARYYENFTNTRVISKDGWYSQLDSFMNTNYKLKNWGTFKEVLDMNNTIAGLYILHDTATTSDENLFYFRLRDGVCSLDICEAANESDTVEIRYGDANTINFRIRVWYQTSTDDFNIEYYNSTSTDWENCLSIDASESGITAYDYKIFTSNNTWTLYVLNQTYGGQTGFYTGTSQLAGWNLCKTNIPMENSGLIDLMYVLSTPINDDSEIYLDHVYSADKVSSACVNNILVSITSIGFATGNPICVGENQQFFINVNDVENDYLTFRVDCAGNGSWSDWTYFTQTTSYGYPCIYKTVGSFNVKFAVSDVCGYPTNSSNTTYLQNVAVSNCYSAGSGGSSTGEVSTSVTGWIKPYTDVVDGYKSEYINFDTCTAWEQDWKAMFLWFCPIVAIGTAILQTVFNWIFSIYFGIALLIVLLIVMYVLLRRKR